MSLIERFVYGHIANFFGTRMGSMNFDRILQSYNLEDIVPDGTKTERLGYTLLFLKNEAPEELANFLEVVIRRHTLNQDGILQLNKYLANIGLFYRDGRVIEIPPEESFFTFFEEALTNPEARPAIEGIGDGALSPTCVSIVFSNSLITFI